MIVCGMLQLNAQSQVENFDEVNYNSVIIDNGFITSIPEMELTRDSELKFLPNSVDNSTTMYMPPIFNQKKSGSCTQCAEIGYVLTYELNRYRNVPAGTSWFGNGQENANLYHPFFTYNLLNEGIHKKGTATGSGFNIAKEIGCSSLVDFYNPILQNLDDTLSSKYWMSGIDKYINAKDNTILYNHNITPFKITWNTKYSSLDNLKYWLSNHNSDSNIGGLAIIIVDTQYATTNIPDGSPESGKKMVLSWGTTGVHALTIVGYNDDIHCFDLNNDGIYKNIDTNGNGEIDLSECEKGAFKVANSWGETSLSTTNGYVYIPYKLINNHSSHPYYNRNAYSCYATESVDEELFIGFTISHPIRENISLGIGANNNINYSTPNDVYSYTYAFKNNGGEYPMNGDINNPQPIDIAFDLGNKLDISNSKKYFIQINDDGYDNNNNAYIQNLQLIDHRWDEEFVINKPERTYTTSDTTLLSINYDLIPFISNIGNYVCSNDKVMRREVNVDKGTFTINNGVNIDMYGTDDFDCVLNINANSSLIIHDDAKITAKQGDCKIVINGDVTIGNNITFKAESGAKLKIIVNNDNNFSIANCIFYNANLELNYSKTNSLTPTPYASISNCMYTATDSVDYAFRINGYDTYSISHNNIQGIGSSTQRLFNDGILVYYSGTYAMGNITDNVIEGCRNSGLTLYSSNANIKLNRISKCGYGVKLLNTSTVNDFMGRCTATNSSDTQYIHDNDNGEVYIYRGCMPERFMYNTITNSNDASLIIYDGRDNLTKATYTVLDIEYNNWGDLSNSDINNQLTYITDNNNVVEFDYNPKWSYGSCVFDNQKQAAMKSSYADSLLEYGNYDMAKITYQDIISEYPTSENAINSMKKLLVAENMYGNDYESLQNYYNNDVSIISNDNLSLLAGTLSNKCDENMENYDKAIEWYENIIEDESTPYNDSIFATIDLGSLYLKMENSGIRGVNGRLRQFIPKSAEAHAENTDSVLRQLKTDNNTTSQSLTLPENFWTDIVTSQPDGYVVDDNGVIHIHTAEALAWLSAVSNGIHGNEPTEFEGVTIILENDIDLSEAKWTPIAEVTDNSYFKGNFNGNGHTIYNTILTDNKDGFFNNLKNAYVQNVLFKNAYMYGNLYNGAFLTSKAYNSIIDRCFIECEYLIYDGVISPFIFTIYETTISNCLLHITSLLDGEIDWSATSHIDSYGIAYVRDNSHIYNCAIIIDKAHAALNQNIGFVNYNDDDCIIENCYIHIKYLVDAPIPVGGPMSRNGIADRNSGLIKNCYFNRDIYLYEYPDEFVQYDNGATSSNNGEIEDTHYYFNENDYWQLKESIVYNESTTDNLLEALNLGADRLINEGYSCAKWKLEGLGFDNMGLPVFDNFNEIININEYKKGDVSIYPNPAKEYIKLSAVSCQLSAVRIYNYLGMLVEEVTVGTRHATSVAKDEIEINVSDYNSGVYFVEVETENGSVTKKFVRN